MTASGRTAAALVASAAVIAAIVLRAVYLSEPSRVDWATFPMFVGDEGAHGLMAEHILGGARPVFYYGAYYHGAFDAYLSAVLFWLFGASLTMLRILPGLFALVGVVASFFVGKRLYGPVAGFLAAALVALPSKFFFDWSVLSLCGYCGYAALVIVAVALAVGSMERVTNARLVGLGVVAGLSIWSNQLSTGFMLPTLAALWLWAPMKRRDWMVLAVAFTVGIAPLLYGNIQTPFATFRQVGRKALFAWTLSQQEGERKAVAVEDEDRDRTYLSNSSLEVLGAQPAIDGELSLGGTVVALVLAAGVIASLRFAWQRRRTDVLGFRKHALLCALIVIGLALGIPSFRGQPIGRYQLPLYPLAAILAAGWLSRQIPRGAAVAVALMGLAHAIDIATPPESEETTPTSAAITALEQRGLTRGFAASPMYEVIFRSDERIVLVPLDHSRYVPYEKWVEDSDHLFYLFRSYQEDKPAHLAFLRYLEENNVLFEKVDVGDYHFLHEFQPRTAVSLAAVARVREDFRKEKFGR